MERKLKVIRIVGRGGPSNKYHDYEMSDGSYRTLTTDEAVEIGTIDNPYIPQKYRERLRELGIDGAVLTEYIP